MQLFRKVTIIVISLAAQVSSPVWATNSTSSTTTTTTSTETWASTAVNTLVTPLLTATLTWTTTTGLPWLYDNTKNGNVYRFAKACLCCCAAEKEMRKDSFLAKCKSLNHDMYQSTEEIIRIFDQSGANREDWDELNAVIFTFGDKPEKEYIFRRPSLAEKKYLELDILGEQTLLKTNEILGKSNTAHSQDIHAWKFMQELDSIGGENPTNEDVKFKAQLKKQFTDWVHDSKAFVRILYGDNQKDIIGTSVLLDAAELQIIIVPPEKRSLLKSMVLATTQTELTDEDVTIYEALSRKLSVMDLSNKGTLTPRRKRSSSSFLATEDTQLLPARKSLDRSVPPHQTANMVSIGMPIDHVVISMPSNNILRREEDEEK